MLNENGMFICTLFFFYENIFNENIEAEKVEKDSILCVENL